MFMVNILIPIAGLGSRFPSNKYPIKPLIPIHGKPMIVRAVESLGIKGNYIFVVRVNEYTDEIVSTIYKYIPYAHIVYTDKLTDGPACSALLCESIINNNHKLVITNCDQIMEWDSLSFMHHAKMYDGCVVTYTSNSKKNSFAKLGNDGKVLYIREKEVISNIALNGIHYWRHGKYFVESAKRMIANNERYNNEFYIGPSFNYMVSSDLHVGIHHIPNMQHNAVGTPEDLKTYLNK